MAEAITSLNNSCYSDITQYGANGATVNVYKSLPVLAVPSIYSQLGTPHPFVQGLQEEVTPCYSESNYSTINRYCPGMSQLFPTVTATGYKNNTVKENYEGPIILYSRDGCGFAQQAEKMFANEIANGQMIVEYNHTERSTPTFKRGDVEIIGLPKNKGDLLSQFM